MAAFEKELMPQLLSVFQQIGVKEIHHKGWRLYAEAFPERKVILTGRDPRDIFVSTYYRVISGKDRFRRGFSAREMARDLNRDFKQQRIMFDTLPCFKVKYEDFCSDRGVFQEIKDFVGSSIVGTGSVGQFNAINRLRIEEAELHAGEITKKHIERWKQESDRELVGEAQRTFDLMPEFVEFWQYER